MASPPPGEARAQQHVCHAARVVLRPTWSSRHQAHLHPCSLLRDRLVDDPVPSVGSIVCSAILDHDPNVPSSDDHRPGVHEASKTARKQAQFLVLRSRCPTQPPPGTETAPCPHRQRTPAVLGTCLTNVHVLPPLLPSLEHPPSEPSSSWLPVVRAVRSALRKEPVTLQHAGIPRPKLFTVTGPFGVGKTTAVAYAAHSAQALLLRVRASNLFRRSVSKSGVLDPLKALLEDAIAAAPAVLLIDDAQFVFPPDSLDDGQAVAAVCWLAARLHSIVEDVCVIFSASPDEIALHPTVLTLCDDALSLQAISSITDAQWALCSVLKQVFPDVLERIQASGHIDSLCRAALGMTIADILQTAVDLQASSEIVGPDGFADALLKRARACVAMEADGLVHVISPPNDDECVARQPPANPEGPDSKPAEVVESAIAGVDEAMRVLCETIHWNAFERDVFEHLGVPPPAGVLVYGPPGTGKTLAVAEACRTCSVPLLTADAAALAFGEVGASERVLRSIYARATSMSPSVVFIDEADSLFLSGAAGCATQGGTAALGRLAFALTRALDEPSARRSGVVTILATNRPWRIPREILRAGRVERQVHMGLPCGGDRGKIAALQCGRAGVRGADEVACVQAWARSAEADGASGADIAGACRRAALLRLAGAVRVGERGKGDVRAHMQEWLEELVVRAGDVISAFRSVGPSTKPEVARRLEEWRLENDATG